MERIEAGCKYWFRNTSLSIFNLMFSEYVETKANAYRFENNAEFYESISKFINIFSLQCTK